MVVSCHCSILHFDVATLHQIGIVPQGRHMHYRIM